MRRAPALCLCVLACGLAMACAALPAQAPSATPELYRCHAANGVIALVSKPDATMKDCVRVWNGATGVDAAPPAAAATSTVTSAPPAASAQSVEDPREARQREAKATILQWCQQHQPPDPKASAKAKAKLIDECVQDKFGTYMLLNP